MGRKTLTQSMRAMQHGYWSAVKSEGNLGGNSHCLELESVYLDDNKLAELTMTATGIC